jgi:epoxyqueuosine reductase
LSWDYFEKRKNGERKKETGENTTSSLYMVQNGLSQIIKQYANELGFDACGIAQARVLNESSQNLSKWLANGYQADMNYMNNHLNLRVDPTKLVEGAKSVIVVLQNYYPTENPFVNAEIKISKYAFGIDYHKVIKKHLKQLYSEIKKVHPTLDGRYFVDSAPVLEKAWASESGLGWIGKNSLLLNKKLGSFTFIGVLIVNTELEYDKPINSYCGNCTRCIDACPTKAIVEPFVVDSNKCISYQTIENKLDIPASIRENNPGWIFGCDICQDVCPWNAKLKPHDINEYNASLGFLALTKETLNAMSEDDFNKLFSQSAIKRAGYEKLLKNVGVD